MSKYRKYYEKSEKCVLITSAATYVDDWNIHGVELLHLNC